MNALEMGANAILFELQHKNLSGEEISLLQKDIFTDAAFIYFENGKGEKVVVPKQNSIVEELVFALQHASSKTFHFYIGENYFFEIAKLRAASVVR